MAPYCPRVAESFIPRGLPLLRDVLGFDKESGKVNNDLASVRKALLNHLNTQYGESLSVVKPLFTHS